MSLRIFLGYDPRETVSYYVASHSIIRQCREPLSIHPVKLDQLPMWRERLPNQSTEFAISRFLAPWVCGYEGLSLFMDTDVLVRCNIREIFNLADPCKAVQVVKHDYTPVNGRKFLGNVNEPYPRKNWSSVMLFNNAMCTDLTPSYVNRATGLELHRFQWIPDELIGDLPVEYNHLVGEYVPNPAAKIVHYTLGGPWFQETQSCEFADEWRIERDRMLHSDKGRS